MFFLAFDISIYYVFPVQITADTKQLVKVRCALENIFKGWKFA
jgi:NADH:ubiquinone oxidoreductase subunit 3 (subunit A)